MRARMRVRVKVGVPWLSAATALVVVWTVLGLVLNRNGPRCQPQSGILFHVSTQILSPRWKVLIPQGAPSAERVEWTAIVVVLLHPCWSTPWGGHDLEIFNAIAVIHGSSGGAKQWHERR